LGFIGTGALTSAIVTGLRSLPDIGVPVVLSPRNADIAADLASRFSGVRVGADNQAVLDDCDTVMLAVRPQVARDVLSELRFRHDHEVVSLIATVPTAEIATLVAPARRVTKALPMPMIALRQGATILCPPNSGMAAFFGRLGGAIEVVDVAEFDALSVVTATFATYFRNLETIHAWLVGQGVAGGTARDYVVSIYKALANAPDTMPGADFAELCRDYATRGGVNEQVVQELEARKVFDAFAQSLDAVHRRIVGG
jgi:pyrroline-5-carboxylate reductase